MTNYDDIYLKKDNHIIQLRIIFGYSGDTKAVESEYNGRIFTNNHDVDDFSSRYHELKDAGYEEVQMYTSFSWDVYGNKIRYCEFEQKGELNMDNKRMTEIGDEVDRLNEDERLFVLWMLLPCYKDLLDEYRKNTLKDIPETVADVMAEYMMAEHERVVDQMRECLTHEIF